MKLKFLGVEESNIIYVGAEAVLVRTKWFGLEAVEKIRVPKPYRDPALDVQIRQQRTIHEAKMLFQQRKNGIPCPVVYEVNLSKLSIVMEYIEGELLKKALPKLAPSSLSRVMEAIGSYCGQLHEKGFVHGDLTTSNVILTPSKDVVFLDFGLMEYSPSLEGFGVDVHLFLRSLESMHSSKKDLCFKYFLEGYAKVRGPQKAEEVLRRVEEIRRRGRYVRKRT